MSTLISAVRALIAAFISTDRLAAAAYTHFFAADYQAQAESEETDSKNDCCCYYSCQYVAQDLIFITQSGDDVNLGAEKRGGDMRTAGDIVKNNDKHIVSVTPDMLVLDVLSIMAESNIGSVLVKVGDGYQGIWTEHDLLRCSLKDDFDPKTSNVGEFMATEMSYADVSETVYDMMDKFLGLRTRHLLVREEGRVIGVVSMGDVVRASLQEKNRQIKDLNAIASWKYYERWKPSSEE